MVNIFADIIFKCIFVNEKKVFGFWFHCISSQGCQGLASIESSNTLALSGQQAFAWSSVKTGTVKSLI